MAAIGPSKTSSAAVATSTQRARFGFSQRDSGQRGQRGNQWKYVTRQLVSRGGEEHQAEYRPKAAGSSTGLGIERSSRRAATSAGIHGNSAGDDHRQKEPQWLPVGQCRSDEALHLMFPEESSHERPSIADEAQHVPRQRDDGECSRSPAGETNRAIGGGPSRQAARQAPAEPGPWRVQPRRAGRRPAAASGGLPAPASRAKATWPRQTPPTSADRQRRCG